MEFYKAEIDGYDVTNTYVPPQHSITYDLNGGTYEGQTGKIVESCAEGEEIFVHAAPTREGYAFVFWEGSVYYPGDVYNVTEDHTFTAVWKKEKPEPAPSPSPAPSPTPDPSPEPRYIPPRTGRD